MRPLSLLAASIVLGLPQSLLAATDVARTPVVVPNSQQYDVRSAGGRDYRIFIAEPAGEAPAAGFPVIYVLDANSVFATVTETLRIQQRRPEITGVSRAVIVGIGYPTSEPFDPERRAQDFGPGADAFLEFIEQELKPEVQARLRIDRARQALFGHSSGGHFVLHALFTAPHAFQTYVSVSPDPHSVEQERAFIARLREREVNVRLLLAAAEFEKKLSPLMRTWPREQREARLEAMRLDRRVDNARDLARRLGAFADRGMRVEFVEFEGENHASVLPVAINRALQFASDTLLERGALQ